ncbi:DMT family transporter [Pseudoxanthomonas sp. CAU 1598]|uniref:DMT family transporter n=2 Tax=Pseudomarimonas arenosa TaxID=2774145 RepID=A0AAW3ZQM1_9GAMM|nr:DMT family transporter [Pseudomarimonas arenosa]
MVLAIGLFSLMDAGLKLLTVHYGAMQVATLRGLSSLPWVLVWIGLSTGFATLWRIRWGLQLLRGALSVAMMAGFVYGFQLLPLTTVYAIFFIAPLMVTALAVPILGEKVGPRRWTAIVIGLVGVLVILRPTPSGLAGVASWAGLAVLGAAVGYSLSSVMVRVLSRTDTTQSLMFWMLISLSLGSALFAWPSWRPVDSGHWGLIIGVGLTGALGQYAITEAFRLGEASLIAPFEYTALAWGVGLDLALFGVLPDQITFVGAGIIVASGLYLLRREKVHAEAEHP